LRVKTAGGRRYLTDALSENVGTAIKLKYKGVRMVFKGELFPRVFEAGGEGVASKLKFVPLVSYLDGDELLAPLGSRGFTP
jgi:hypothetical protein